MRAVEDLVDRERELEKELKRLQYRKRKVICQIQSLNNPLYSRVLYLRYVKNMHWDTIAKIVGKGERQVYRIHNQALQSFENKFLI